MTIVYAMLILGGLGLAFGLALSFASKKFHVETDARVEQVRACLGGANCGACGFAGCDAFAQAVVKGEAKVDGCPPAGTVGAQRIAAVMGQETGDHERLIARIICQGTDGVAKPRCTYDGYRSCASAADIAGGPKACRFACVGLGDCANHCAFGAITMKDGIACIDPDKCKSCGACVKACPRDVIRMLPASKDVIVRCRNTDPARAARQVCAAACISCGRCKKECQHDAIIIENNCARIDPEKCVRCGACVPVCPCKCITIGGIGDENTGA